MHDDMVVRTAVTVTGRTTHQVLLTADRRDHAMAPTVDTRKRERLRCGASAIASADVNCWMPRSLIRQYRKNIEREDCTLHRARDEMTLIGTPSSKAHEMPPMRLL